MAYASASDVAGYTSNLLGSNITFTGSTCPIINAVNTWLSSGCSVIESTLASNQYSVPVASGTVAYEWLKDLNALYAAARAEMSRTNITLAPGERTRGTVYDEMFWDQLGRLTDGDFTLAGLGRVSSGKLFVGGISKTSKQTYESDTDRVAPRFNRGAFNFPGTIDPAGTTAS